MCRCCVLCPCVCVKCVIYCEMLCGLFCFAVACVYVCYCKLNGVCGLFVIYCVMTDGLFCVCSCVCVLFDLNVFVWFVWLYCVTLYGLLVLRLCVFLFVRVCLCVHVLIMSLCVFVIYCVMLH